MSNTETGMLGSEVCRGNVQSEWIDLNDHMNVAYYVLAFDQGVDALWHRFGITNEYISDSGGSTFAVEVHVTYQRELRRDDPFVITSQVLAYDAKRIHQFMRMYHAEEHYLAATAEWMNLHVDLGLRKVSPWPEPILEGIRSFVDGQPASGLPAEAGQRMKVPAPYWSVEDYSW